MATKSIPSNFRLSATSITVFAHLLVVAVITLLLVWLLRFREGLALQSEIKPKIFNVHPLLMVIGFILIAGEAMMAYKVLPLKKEGQKLVHLIMHLMALVSGTVGIYAVFKFHHELGIPHLYSLHSWIGISTICLFVLQWVASFLSFSWPGTEKGTRTKISPWHVFLGIAIFFMAILSAETGLMEKFTFLQLRRSQEALVLNFTALLILLFAITVGLTLFLPSTLLN